MTDDHARPIPRRPARDGADDDVYVVDTRSRRGAPRRTPRDGARGPRAGAAAAAPPPGAAAYDELGRPLPRGGATPPAAPPPGARTRRRGRGRTGVSVLALLVVAYLVFLVVAPLHAWSNVSRVDVSPEGRRPAAGDGHTYLLVGSDSREGLTAAQKRALGTGSADGRRTDTIILVHVPSGGGKSSLISVPRDSYLPIPGHGKNKVNASFSIAARSC